MKLFRKEILSNGRCHIYFCGIKIASYKVKKHLMFGKDNSVINCPPDCNVIIFGTNNKVIFGKNIHWTGRIAIGYQDTPADNCTIIIGDNSRSNGVEIQICEDDTCVEIGSDCLFSWNVNIWASDTHSVTDIDGNITNIGKYIKIGKHVWIGMGATICKNTTIADNCIIGTKAVVSGNFKTKNCVIAGNPAKIIKEKTNWDQRRPKQYMQDVKRLSNEKQMV